MLRKASSTRLYSSLEIVSGFSSTARTIFLLSDQRLPSHYDPVDVKWFHIGLVLTTRVDASVRALCPASASDAVLDAGLFPSTCVPLEDRSYIYSISAKNCCASEHVCSLCNWHSLAFCSLSISNRDASFLVVLFKFRASEAYASKYQLQATDCEGEENENA